MPTNHSHPPTLDLTSPDPGASDRFAARDNAGSGMNGHSNGNGFGDEVDEEMVQAVEDLSLDQLRAHYLSSRTYILQLESELQHQHPHQHQHPQSYTKALGKAPSSSPQGQGQGQGMGSLPSRKPIYDLNKVVEGDDSLVNSADEAEADAEGGDDSVEAEAGDGDRNMARREDDGRRKGDDGDGGVNEIETGNGNGNVNHLEVVKDEAESGLGYKKKRPASILGLKRIPSSIVQSTLALHHSPARPLHPHSHSHGQRTASSTSYTSATTNGSPSGRTSPRSHPNSPLPSPSPTSNLPFHLGSAQGLSPPGGMDRPLSPQTRVSHNHTNQLDPPRSPKRITHPSVPTLRSRKSTPGNPHPTTSTAVIDSLSSDVALLRAQLDRVKDELRLSQRQVGVLTRGNEDLRETRERLRGEVEGVGKQAERKGKLLAEVLDRARKAEASLSDSTKSRKLLESSTHKQLSDMTQKLTEAQTLAHKSEREMISLREGVGSLREMHKREVGAVKGELVRVVEAQRRGLEEAAMKRSILQNQLQAQKATTATLQSLKEDSDRLTQEMRKAMQEQLDELREEMKRDEGVKALEMASALTEELQRLKRLMKADVQQTAR